MWKPSLAVAVALIVVTTTVTGIVAPSNEAPLADAGLDQQVTKGTSVHLDGTGSRDPDGAIARYRWTIRTPSNAAVAPDCPTCARASFDPAEIGRYRVTLTVTDADGESKSDTLYVDVSPGAEPDISLSGPTEPTEGAQAAYAATLDAGAAELERVVWSVDGVEIANHSVSPDQKVDTVSRRFPTPGSRAITATVHDVDGQTGADSLEVTAQAEPDRSSDSTDPDPSTSIANRTTPVVDGDAVVTGSKPLRGQYGVRFDAAAADIDSIEWQNVSTRVGRGAELTRTWEPGDHELYAVVSYVDGSENVATFSDGSTSVVADPRPNVSIASLDRFGSASGTAIGADEYENLDTLRVEFDGETIATTPPASRRRYRTGTGRRQRLDFSRYEFTPGERHQITVIATDDRGQVSRTSTEIVPVKEPEIIKSEFVNGPVDSYHERIDPSRYTAHHVLKIDLNGVDRENVSTPLYTKSSDLSYLGKNQSYSESSDILRVDSFWAGIYPGEYKSGVRYRTTISENGWEGTETNSFEVTPSKPELRIDVLTDGTRHRITRNHGITVDASGSFDPDKTDLKYIWKYGATPTKPDNTTAEFSAYQRAASIVEDQYDLRTERNLDFLDDFLPEIASKEVVSSGPYSGDETVRLRIETEPYFFSKDTYYDQFDLGISVNHPRGSVERWERLPASAPEYSESIEDPVKRVGVVEIPASALSSMSGEPLITVYNEGNSRKQETVSFSGVETLTKDGEYWTNLSVDDMSYVLEKPQTREVTVDSSRDLNRYLRHGYSIDQRHRQTEYALEERVKVADAEYETETKDFRTRQAREPLLSSEWYASGTHRKEVTRTKTETGWRDSLSGPQWGDSNLWNGEFTGETRRVVVEPAEYRTERQYEREYEVEKTGTRTVTKTRRIPVEKTGTRTVTKCLRGLGCYETTETYTYHTIETRTYTVTRTYTYTVTRTRTYWAASGSRVNGRFTGKTRRVKVEDAVYGTEYKVKQKSHYTDTVWVYEASRRKLVRPAQYEWQTVRTTSDGQLAYRVANSRDDWRVGRSTTVTSWELSKQTGTTRVESNSYANAENVVETSATVSGDVVQQYLDEQTGKRNTQPISDKTVEVTYQGAKPPWRIINTLEENISR